MLIVPLAYCTTQNMNNKSRHKFLFLKIQLVTLSTKQAVSPPKEKESYRKFPSWSFLQSETTGAMHSSK